MKTLASTSKTIIAAVGALTLILGTFGMASPAFAAGASGTSQWYVTDGGATLHVGPGTVPESAVGNTPWESVKTPVTKVIFDDPANTAFSPSTQGMFAGMRNLTSIVGIGKVDTSKVTDMSEMFWNATWLSSLDVAGWNTSKVTDMSWMFANAARVPSLDVSKWDTSKVVNMRSAFHEMSALKSLDVSKWNTSNVTDMKDMFASASSLTSLDVSKWNTSKVTDMEEMFAATSSLKSLDVSKWDTSNVTTMATMFSSASSLTSLDVSKWNTSKVTAMNSMFLSASSLTSLDLSKWDTSKVTTLSSTFGWTRSLKSLNVSTWKTGNVTNMNGTFYGAASLSSLDLSKWDTGKVTDMVDMFRDTAALTTLNVSGWNTSKVEYMSSMFRWASALKSLDLSGWNTTKLWSTRSMFESANALTSLNLSGWDTRSAGSTDYMFYSTPKLSKLTLGPLTRLGNDTSLADAPVSDAFTGKWQSGSWVGGAKDLIARSQGSNAAGTYVWQAVVKKTLTAAVPKISGTAKVGKKLTANPGTWTSGTSMTYQWLRGGKPISKATKSTYTLTASDLGTKITVKVTGTKSGYTTASKTSAPTKTVAKGTFKAPTPKISGKAKVGKKLTAKPGTWSPKAKVSYQWMRNGKAIKKATKSTYTLKAADRGKKITVKVTGKKTGYATVTKTSKATGKVKK